MTVTYDSYKKIIEALDATGADESRLYAQASQLRTKHFGARVHVWAVVVFSNYCRQTCVTCALNRTRDDHRRFRLHADEIVHGVKRAVLAGIKTIVLHAAEDDGLDAHWMRDLILRIRRQCDASLIISAGSRTPRERRIWLSAAPRVYVRGFSPLPVPGDDVPMVIARSLQVLRSRDQLYAGIELVIPSVNDLRAHTRAAQKSLILHSVALMRIMRPELHISAPVIWGYGARDFLRQGLQAGADLLMQDYTPSPYAVRHAASVVPECLGATRRECGSCLYKITEPLERHVDMSFI